MSSTRAFVLAAPLFLLACASASSTTTPAGGGGGASEPGSGDPGAAAPACESVVTHDATGALPANANGLHALTLRDAEGVAAVSIDRRSPAPAYRFSRFGLDGTRVDDVAIVPRDEGDAGFSFANVADSYLFARVTPEAVDVRVIDAAAKVSSSLRIAPSPNAGRVDSDPEKLTVATVSAKQRPQLRSKGDTASLTWKEMINEDISNSGHASLTAVALLDAEGKLVEPVRRRRELYITAADIAASGDQVFVATRNDTFATNGAAKITIARLARGSSSPLSSVEVEVPWPKGTTKGDLTSESVRSDNIVLLGAAGGGVDLVSSFCDPNDRTCGLEVHRFDARLQSRGKHRLSSERDRAILAMHAIAHEGVLYAVWADTDCRSYQFDATDLTPDALHAVALDDAGKTRRTDLPLGIPGAQIQTATPIAGARVANGALEVSFTWEKKRVDTNPDYEAHGGSMRFCFAR